MGNVGVRRGGGPTSSVRMWGPTVAGQRPGGPLVSKAMLSSICYKRRQHGAQKNRERVQYAAGSARAGHARRQWSSREEDIWQKKWGNGIGLPMAH